MSELFIREHRQNETLKTIHKKRYWVTRVNLNQGLNFTSDIEPTLVEFDIHYPKTLTDEMIVLMKKTGINMDNIINVSMYRIVNDQTVDSIIPEYDKNDIPISVFNTEIEAQDEYREQLKDIRYTLEKRIEKTKAFDTLIQNKIKKGE